MLPLLQALADGREHLVRDLRESIAAQFGLAAAEREVLLPSGKQPIFDNRLGWAKTYLAKAGLVASVRRGVYQLTERGRSVIAAKPARVDTAFLGQYAEFQEFQRKPDDDSSDEPDLAPSREGPRDIAQPAGAATPQESLDAAYHQLRRALETELLTAVRSASFRFFERLVVELLVKMGYGGSLKDAGKAIGRSGDDGLDGVIKEDHLGLDAIYLQAKRWEKTVGRPEVQAFAGSLEGYAAAKGCS